MPAGFEHHTKWISISALFVVAIIFLLPGSSYKVARMEITRTEAINLATDFLKSQNINVDKFSVEGFLNEDPIENRYLIKKLGNDKFYDLLNSKGIPAHGWRIFFHDNSPNDGNQILYTVVVKFNGDFLSYRRDIPDSIYANSFATVEQAEDYVKNFIRTNVSLNIDHFQLTDKKSVKLAQRNDYSFSWKETLVKEDSISLILKARVQGDKIGLIDYYYDVPNNERSGFEFVNVFVGIISVIFVFFLFQIAFFQFLKKYHQGEIWMSVGKSLFAAYFIISFISILNDWPGQGTGWNIGTLNFLSVKIIMILFKILIINLVLSLLLFASWSVGESFTRGLWPNKFRGIDAVIKGKIFSVSAGASLLKGFTLGLGAGLIYLIAPYLTNKESAFCVINPISDIGIYSGFSPVLDIFTKALSVSLLSGVAVTFFITNLTYYRFRNTKLSIILTGLVTVAAAVISNIPFSLGQFWVNIVFWFALGCLYSYIYLKFDLLTLLSFQFHTILLQSAFVLYFGSTSFYNINFIILFIIFLIVPVIYIVSRYRNKEFVLENYGLPSHVQKISERERLRKELEIASKVQLSLLPKEKPDAKGYDIAGLSIPAVEAGGDYYDFVTLKGNKMGIAIGDVSGKGIGAAIYMTLTKGILQAHAEESASPKAVLSKVNRLLYKTIEKNSFVSMFYAVLDISNHTMVYSRAGHNPGIMCSNSNGTTKLLMSKGIALGLEEGAIFSSTLLEETISIEEQDLIVLYTDGFTEAMNEKQEFYGEEKLIELIRKHHELTSKDLINLVLKEVNKFAGHMPQHDDMTIVIIKRT